MHDYAARGKPWHLDRGLVNPVSKEKGSVPSRQRQVIYHHLGNNNVPAIFRNKGACAAVASGMEQELEATATLEQDKAAVSAHFEKVTLQLKRANYLQGTVPDGNLDELGFPGFKRDEANGWIFGNHPLQTTDQAKLFKEMLISHHHCFTYHGRSSRI
jgi:hypothetical protein